MLALHRWALRNWPRHREKMMYLVVGGWNSFFVYGCFSVLYFLLNERLAPSAILAIAYVVASVNGYLTFRYLVFAPVRHPVVEYVRYQAVYLPIQVFNLVALPLAMTYTNLSAYIVQALLAPFAVAGAYLGNKYFTFRKQTTAGTTAMLGPAVGRRREPGMESSEVSPVAHSLSQGCPVCQGTLQSLFVMPRLKTARCPNCGHRVATHESETVSSLDYHRQYDQGVFLDSLRATRKRQAQRIIQAIRRALPDCDQVLDFGAGRGWFLDACRDAGMRDVAAADTSAMAVEAARARGIVGLLVNDDGSDLDVAALPFAPRVLTLLDVIEHFPPPELLPRIDALLRALPSVQIVVVKVPVSSGPLYASATLMARIGLGGAIEQLYQVGTNPPHYNYFSRSSLRRLLKRCGLTPIEMFGDLDFEPRLLPDRVHLLRGLPGAVKWPISWLAVAMCRLLPTRDSIICLSATAARSQPPEA